MSYEKTVTVNSRSIGIFSLLGLLFVALKLTGFIDWSWWLVLFPFYGGFLIVAVAAIVLLIIGAIVVWREEKNADKS